MDEIKSIFIPMEMLQEEGISGKEIYRRYLAVIKELCELAELTASLLESAVEPEEPKSNDPAIVYVEPNPQG